MVLVQDVNQPLGLMDEGAVPKGAALSLCGGHGGELYQNPFVPAPDGSLSMRCPLWLPSKSSPSTGSGRTG